MQSRFAENWPTKGPEHTTKTANLDQIERPPVAVPWQRAGSPPIKHATAAEGSGAKPSKGGGEGGASAHDVDAEDDEHASNTPETVFNKCPMLAAS